jgi:YidC/Oxa1 family membrane protein insertase
MNAFFELFANILAWFYSLVPNYAVAIILLTLLVMVIVTPLTLKGTRSMMIMQKLQPEMRKIQQKYKDDRQKQNEELLKFYKENEINPLGGCLPLLVQLPVFIVLYQVLRGLTLRQPSLGFDVGWVTGNGPTDVPSVERTFDPAYVNHNSDLYHDLSNTTQMTAFGLDLSESASQALSQGILHALPYLALIAIVAVTGVIQQRQIQGRNTGAQVNPQQQAIMRLMPVFLPLISFGLPAGLVLYFSVSNLYRIGQQAFISRSIYGMSRDEQRANRQKTKELAKSGKSADGKDADGGDAGGKSAEGASDGTGEKTAPAKKAREKGTTTPAGKKPAGRANAKGDRNKGKKVSAASTRSQRSTRTSNRSGRGSGNGAQSAPTLQPRARKKKR